jgi:VWFA-related protein
MAVHGPAVDEDAAQQTPVFRTAADLVTVGVAVRASGSPVGGLHASDFLVLDNGVPQTIESIDSEAVPADVTVLVETGEDIQDYLGSVNKQLEKILALIRPDDRVRVLGIDTYVTEILPLQRAADRPAISKLHVGGWTSAHDALAAALLQSSDPERRQLIIAVTDAVDGISTLTAETIRDLAKQSPAELHIAYVTLACGCPPPVYFTSAERLADVRALTGGRRAHTLLPYHQPAVFRFTHDFAVLREAAEITGGNGYLPGIFTDRTAAGIFSKVYDDYRHSYVIRFAPQGVKRGGWHELTVTLPKYPSVEISARRGYGGDAPAPSAAPAPVAPATPSYDAIADPYRRSTDVTKAIKNFRSSVGPLAVAPDLEAILTLELAAAGFRSGRDDAREAAADLLIGERQLVARPIEPDDFERLWLWTALASFESMTRPAYAEPFIKAALVRMPDEPRLVLGRAFLRDQQSPVGVLEQPDPSVDARIAEVSALYDAAMKFPDTAAEARVRKAWFLHRNAHHDEALTLLNEAKPRATDPVLIFWLDLFRGQVLESLGRNAEAITAFRAAVAAFPRSQSANVALMNALVRAGARDDAKAIAERIQTLGGGDDDPYWMYWSGDFRFYSAAMSRLRDIATERIGFIKK